MYTSPLCAISTTLFFTVLMAIPLIGLAQAPTSDIIPCGLSSDINVATGCTFNDLIILAQNVINFLIFRIAAPLAAIMFAYAGFLYVTNRGNEGQVTQAHDIFLYVFWGLVIALAAWLFVNFILTFLLGDASSFNYLGQ